ncbi:MAG: response regulator [Cyanobacteria bacterium Co-bin13]|nr:response regulator [Cyanobacteria bacterium Co-bin13]
MRFSQLSAEAPQWALHLDSVADPAQVQPWLRSQQADLVVLDLNLQFSSGTGLSVLQALHQEHPELPVIVLTNRDSLEDRIAASRLSERVYLRTVKTLAGAVCQF